MYEARFIDNINDDDKNINKALKIEENNNHMYDYYKYIDNMIVLTPKKDIEEEENKPVINLMNRSPSSSSITTDNKFDNNNNNNNNNNRDKHLFLTPSLNNLKNIDINKNILEKAIGIDNLSILQCISGKVPDLIRPYLLKLAASKGAFNCVKWLYVYGMCKTTTIIKEEESNNFFGMDIYSAFGEAIANGYRKIVKYLGPKITYIPPNYYSVYNMDQAAIKGYMKILKHIYSYEKTGIIYKTYSKFSTRALDGAIKNKHLSTAMWLVKNSMEGCTQEGIDEAIKNNYLELLKRIYNNQKKQGSSMSFIKCYSNAMDYALANDNIDTGLWVKKYLGAKCSKKGFTDALNNNARHSLEWLFINKPDISNIRNTLILLGKKGDPHNLMDWIQLSIIPLLGESLQKRHKIL